MAADRYRHIFLFTGQGAQYHGMARSLYRSEPVFRKWMDALDRVPVRTMSSSVTAFLYPTESGGRSAQERSSFDRTLFSHPALFMVQFALAKTLADYGIRPDCLVGASLGEYVALSLAGRVPPRTMLEALIAHARALEHTCAPGAMIGVEDRPERYEQDPVIRENCSLAGISSPKHFVVSGEKAAMDRVARHLEHTGTGFQRLPIRFGFHSSNVEPAMPVWKTQLEKIRRQRPRMEAGRADVISCCTGRRLNELNDAHLMAIGRGPIRFRDALNTLNDRIKDCQAAAPVNILDLGPGSYSSGFVRQNGILDRRVRIYRIMTLFGNETRNMEKIKSELISP